MAKNALSEARLSFIGKAMLLKGAILNEINRLHQSNQSAENELNAADLLARTIEVLKRS